MEHKRKQFASEGSERMFVTGKTSFETVMVKPKLDPLNRLAFFLVVRNESIQWNENLAKASKYVFYSKRYFHLLRNTVMSTRMSPFAKQFLSGKATDNGLKRYIKFDDFQQSLVTLAITSAVFYIFSQQSLANPCHYFRPLLPSCFLLQCIFFIEITCKIS